MDQEQEIHNYCEVGQHDVGEQGLKQCFICKRSLCYAHQGNPDTSAGNLVGCLEHAIQVEAMNQAALLRHWERQRRQGRKDDV